MLNKELWMVLVPAVSWFLFALGGTQISDKIKGQKWLRRYLLPAFWLSCVIINYGLGWVWIVRAIAVFGLGVGFLIMGYGDGKSWLYRFMVGCLYGLISLPIGVSMWNAVVPAMFFVYFFLSNFKYTAKMFTWKVCEGTFGLFIGISIAYLLMGLGIVW
jgi:hypothetical protein